MCLKSSTFQMRAANSAILLSGVGMLRIMRKGNHTQAGSVPPDNLHGHLI